MRDLNLLWLYDDLLDLYGDFGNVAIIVERLGRMGFHCVIHRQGIADQPDFSAHQIVYIGPGKAKNLARAAEHFVNHAQAVKQAVEQGVLFFITGNARLLFGREFTGQDGKVYPGVGLFPYTGRETGEVFICDVVARPTFDPQSTGYGFINRTAHIDGNDSEFLFDLVVGSGDNETTATHEGNLRNNFFGTWQLGPVLVKNPHLLAEVLRRLTGDDYMELDSSLEQKALDATLAEFNLK